MKTPTNGVVALAILTALSTMAACRSNVTPASLLGTQGGPGLDATPIVPNTDRVAITPPPWTFVGPEKPGRLVIELQDRADLKARLTALLAPPAGEWNLIVAVNNSQGVANDCPASAAPSWATGVPSLGGGGCLVVSQDALYTGPSSVGKSDTAPVRLLDVLLTDREPAIDTPKGSILASAMGANRGLPLPGFQGLAIVLPDAPGGGTTSLNPQTWIVNKKQNAEIRLRFHPEALATNRIVTTTFNKLGAGGQIDIGIDRPGIFLPFTLEFFDDQGLGWKSHQHCEQYSIPDPNGGFGGITSGRGTIFRLPASGEGVIGQCPKILQEANSQVFCTVSSIGVDVTLRRVHGTIGFVPQTIPNCDPRAPRQDLAWMKPFGWDATGVGCLSVVPVVSLEFDPEEDDLTGTNLTIQGCEVGTKLLDLVCPLLGCDTPGAYLDDALSDAGSGSTPSVVQRITSLLALTPQAQQLVQNPAFDWAACKVDGACLQNVIVPAAIQRLTMGWFGQMLGGYQTPANGAPTAPPPGQSYPVVDVGGCQEPGFTYDRQFGHCVKCPNPTDQVQYACCQNFNDLKTCTVTPVPNCAEGTQTACTQGGQLVALATVHAAESPNKLFYTVLADNDGDGFLNPFDNCPDVKQVNQDDMDGDHWGDACDDCKGDPNEHDPFTENDMDGVCAAVDNCPQTKTHNLNNCNKDSEVARGVLVLGDACDPVPCPTFSVAIPEFKEKKGPLFSGVRSWTLPSTGTFTMTGIAPRVADAAEETPVITTIGGEPTPSGPQQAVEFRYCINQQTGDPTAPDFAHCAGSQAVSDKFLFPQNEDKQGLWHKVNVAHPSYAASLSFDEVPKHPIHWNWRLDYLGWLAAAWNTNKPWIPAVPDTVITTSQHTGSAFTDGRFWTHANTRIGLFDGPPLPPVGIHAGDMPDELANHYQDVTLQTVEANGPIGTVPKFPFNPCVLIECAVPCVTCGVDPPTLETCDVCGLLHPGAQISNPWVGYLGFTVSNQLAVVGESGSRLLGALGISSATRSYLTDPAVRLVRHAEASPMLGRGPWEAQALVVSVDGSALVDQLFASQGGIATRLETFGRGAPPRVAAHAAHAAPPETALNPGLVYARTVGRLYALGGTDALRLATVSTEPGAEWTVQRLTAPLGAVKSATYALADGGLWLVDAVSGPGKRVSLRLVRVDPATATVRVVRTWKQPENFESWWLVADTDGELLLFASSAREQKHLAFRIVTAAPTRLSETRRAKGALTAQPVADALTGYALPLGDTERTPAHIARLRVLGSRFEKGKPKDPPHGHWDQCEREGRWDDLDDF